MKNLVITALVFMICILMFTACSSTRDGGRTIIVSTPADNEELKKSEVKEAGAMEYEDNSVALVDAQ